MAMLQSMIVAPPDEVRPTYSIYHFIDGVYKVVKFRSIAPVQVPHSMRCKKGNTEKLDASLSRSKRIILELALCNDWTYFITITLNKDKHDRFNLSVWHDKFTDWLRYQRKKGYHIDYLLIPERHEDGAWHMHGLINLDMPLVSFADLRKQGHKVPNFLVNNGYLNWPAYQKKFGFCSLDVVRSKIATSYYMTKYATKDLSRNVDTVGGHMHYHSTGLKKPVKHGDIYGDYKYLDGFLDHVYDFCATGMTQVKDNLGWDFALEYMEVQPWNVPDEVVPDVPGVAEVDTWVNCTQMCINEL